MAGVVAAPKLDLGADAASDPAPSDAAAAAPLAPSGLSAAEIESFVPRCADYIDVKRVSGDAFAIDVWVGGGETREGSEQECRRIATEDRGAHDLLVAAIDQLEEFFAGAQRGDG